MEPDVIEAGGMVSPLSAHGVETKLKYAKDTIEGLENTPQAFIGLFAGENPGKQLVNVS